MRLETDPALRKALHGLYVALFEARLSCPDDFHRGRLTTIQTAIMGIEDHGWRVIGITREALDLLATVDFDKNKMPRRLCRGHVTDRIQTTGLLFDRHGILATVERVVRRSNPTEGYEALVQMGLHEFTFEAVVLRYPKLFSRDAIARANERMVQREKPPRSAI